MKVFQFIYTEQGSNECLGVGPEISLITDESNSTMIEVIKSNKAEVRRLFKDLGIQAFQSTIGLLSTVATNPFIIVIGRGYILANTHKKNILIEIYINNILVDSIPIIVNKC